MPYLSLGSCAFMSAFLDLDYIPSSSFSPLPAGSEVIHSPSYCLCPLWEQNICAHLLCPPERGWWTIKLLSIQISSYPESWNLCLFGPNVIFIGPHLPNEWGTLCHNRVTVSKLHLSPSVFRWGWCPWKGRGLLFSLTSCCFFICCFHMGMEWRRWNSKWESSLCSSKITEDLHLGP